jgi:NAD(P)H-dependent FMN reductase
VIEASVGEVFEATVGADAERSEIAGGRTPVLFPGAALVGHMARDHDESTDAVHVAGVVGSLADRSVTRVAVGRALAAAAEGGATTDLIDLRDLHLPTFDADDRDAGDAPALRERLQRADAILLGTPMYHGSYSSPLKAALDYSGFDEFENTTVGLLAVAGGSFPITALDHLRSVLRALDAWVVPFQAAVPNSSSAVEWTTDADDTDADDTDVDTDDDVGPDDDATTDHERVTRVARFADEGIEERVATLGRRVVQYANIEPDPVSFEGEQNVGAE